MVKVYVVDDDKSCDPMDAHWCKDEVNELQTLLEKNPVLLPGDQISPDDPRRWLLVAREMPVP